MPRHLLRRIFLAMLLASFLATFIVSLIMWGLLTLLTGGFHG